MDFKKGVLMNKDMSCTGSERSPPMLVRADKEWTSSQNNDANERKCRNIYIILSKFQFSCYYK